MEAIIVLLEFNAMDEKNMYRMVHEIYSEASYEIAKEKHPEVEEIEDLEEAIKAEGLYFVEFLKKFMSKTQSRYYVLEVNGQWVSALRLTKIDDFYYMEALETAPEQRRNGYASKLIKDVISLLKVCGKVVMRSNVNKTNMASLATHKKCGFAIERETALNYLTGKTNEQCYGMIYVSGK